MWAAIIAAIKSMATKAASAVGSKAAGSAAGAGAGAGSSVASTIGKIAEGGGQAATKGGGGAASKMGGGMSMPMPKPSAKTKAFAQPAELPAPPPLPVQQPRGMEQSAPTQQGGFGHGLWEGIKGNARNEMGSGEGTWNKTGAFMGNLLRNRSRGFQTVGDAASGNTDIQQLIATLLNKGNKPQ